MQDNLHARLCQLISKASFASNADRLTALACVDALAPNREAYVRLRAAVALAAKLSTDPYLTHAMNRTLAKFPELPLTDVQGEGRGIK
jgi:hypothetical protein